MKEKKIIQTKTYTVTVHVYEDLTERMVRTNDGFGALELLGISGFIGVEIKDQIQGKIQPDVIKREVVERRKSKTK